MRRSGLEAQPSNKGLEVGLARCFKVEKSFSGSDKKEQKSE